MKKILLPLTLLAFAAACGDRSPTNPAATDTPQVPGATFDNISNFLDASIDAVAEVMPLTVGGANGTTTLYVDPTNGDGKNGCNFQNDETLVVAVSSSNPAAATVSPSSLTFGACGDVKTLTVTPVAAGSATITVSQSSNNTGASFNLAPATFTVNVTSSTPANTAPKLTISGVTGGSQYAKGSVPVAMCDVVDTEDGNSSFAATLSTITGPYASDGIGSQTADCDVTDSGGQHAAGSVTYTIVDLSAPSIDYVVAPTSPDGKNGWYQSDVTLTWSVNDPESPNSLLKTGAKTGCVDQSITVDQAATEYSCSATSAGGSASKGPVTIKRDGTAPTISGSRTPAANGFGWNNTDVDVKFSCDDNLSGVASCGPDQTFSSEGAGHSATGDAEDNAGNNAIPATVSDINIDKTNPSVSLDGGPANGGSYYFGSVPAAPTCSASDLLAGLDGTCSVGGYSPAVGTHTVKATAADKAGNEGSASATYTVKAWTLNGFYQPTDMNDVWNTVKGGSTVPLKFEIFAGSELTDVNAIDSFKVTKIACTTSDLIDEIELVTTGGTVLRYDTIAGQFIQNWQTPKTAGVCYRVTLTTDDGSSITALFKLK